MASGERSVLDRQHHGCLLISSPQGHSGKTVVTIGLCRALLADPDWPVKAKEGLEREIVRWVACNWCLEADSRYEKVNCTRWPGSDVIAPEPFLPGDAKGAKFKEEYL